MPPTRPRRTSKLNAGDCAIREGVVPQIRAVCFDGFGTLVDIGDKRRPFKAMLGEASSSEAVTKVLTTPVSLRDLARHIPIPLDEKRLLSLEEDLVAECRSTYLRPGIETIWQILERLELKIAVCSNLAMEYGDALVGCLPRAPDALVLSFEAGLMKPQAGIYQLVCRQLELEPDQVLFVGDSLKADVHGPEATGLFAMHIDALETGVAKGRDRKAPPAIAELFKRVGDLGPQKQRHLSYSSEEALNVALGSISAITRLDFERDDLLHVLRRPAEVMQGRDPVLKLLLSAFFDETSEVLLTRIVEGSEVSWTDLSRAVNEGLQPGHRKRAWIAARAKRFVGLRP